MSIRRSLLGLAALAMILAAGLPALSNASGGPCSPSTPQYCGQPKVKTGPAKHVTSTSATLTGTVNPNGSATTCHFEYGTTKHYGSITPSQNVGSGNKPEKVSATITGLSPNTTYHYQLVCSNLGGTATGGDKTFKTQHRPGKPHTHTNRARHKRSHSATLRGTVNPNGSPTTCHFRYGRSTSYGSSTPGQSVGSGTTPQRVTATIHGLMSKAVYHFRLLCSNRGGHSQGRDQRVETLNTILIRGSQTILVTHKGSFLVTLHCGGNHRCVGGLTLEGPGGQVLAQRVRYVVGSHHTERIRMHLTPAAQGQIGQRHHLAGRLRARDLDGSSASRRVQLRARQGNHLKHGPISTG